MFRAPASEFPNDNEELHRGTIWLSDDDPCAPPRARTPSPRAVDEPPRERAEATPTRPRDDAAPLERTPVARIDVMPLDAAPIDASSSHASPLDAAPFELAPLDVSRFDVSRFDVSPFDDAPIDDAPIEIVDTLEIVAPIDEGCAADTARFATIVPPPIDRGPTSLDALARAVAPLAAEVGSSDAPAARAADDDAPRSPWDDAPPPRTIEPPAPDADARGPLDVDAPPPDAPPAPPFADGPGLAKAAPRDDAWGALLRVCAEVARDAGCALTTSLARALDGDPIAAAWAAVLRGDSDDFAACGAAPLDEWAATTLARLADAPARATQLRRALRARGVAAFGLVDAA